MFRSWLHTKKLHCSPPHHTGTAPLFLFRMHVLEAVLAQTVRIWQTALVQKGKCWISIQGDLTAKSNVWGLSFSQKRLLEHYPSHFNPTSLLGKILNWPHSDSTSKVNGKEWQTDLEAGVVCVSITSLKTVKMHHKVSVFLKYKFNIIKKLYRIWLISSLNYMTMVSLYFRYQIIFF